VALVTGFNTERLPLWKVGYFSINPVKLNCEAS
jgi:hypothetical protein